MLLHPHSQQCSVCHGPHSQPSNVCSECNKIMSTYSSSVPKLIGGNTNARKEFLALQLFYLTSMKNQDKSVSELLEETITTIKSVKDIDDLDQMTNDTFGDVFGHGLLRAFLPNVQPKKKSADEDQQTVR